MIELKVLDNSAVSLDVIESGAIELDVTMPTGGGAVINNQNKSVTPTESEQNITYDSAQGYTGLGTVTVGAIDDEYVGSAVPRKSSSDLTVSGATVTAPSGYYSESASKSVTTMTLPTAPTSSATSGYTKVGSNIGRSTSTRYINIPEGYHSSGEYYQISAVANGTAGTPTATKGAVSNHSVNVTPSVTNTTGYITGSTKTGTAVSVSASELVSGTKSITANGTGIDVTNYASVDVAVSGGITPTGTISITQNGTTDVTNYASASVSVPNTYSASDEGKVVSNGALVSQTSDSVTQNGTVDTTLINSLTVNVSGGELPSIYQEVEYIDTNNTFAYIATDYTPERYDIVTGLVSFNSQPAASTDFIIFYAGLDTRRLRMLYGSNSGGTHYLRYSNFNATLGNQQTTQPINKWHAVVANSDTGDFTLGSVTKTQAYSGALDGDNTTFTLGATLNSTTVRIDGKFARWQIMNFNSGEMKLNLIPCYRKSDNVIGMYDAVSKTFYTNAGTGAFLKGDDILSSADALSVLLGGAE